MILKKVQEAKELVCKDREDVVEKLLCLCEADLLVFLSPDEGLRKQQESDWNKIVCFLKDVLKVDFYQSESLLPAVQSDSFYLAYKNLISSFSDEKLAIYYVASTILRSTLIALAFVMKKIDSKEAFQSSFIEELWQAKFWGVDEFAQNRRDNILEELVKLESLLGKIV